MPHYGAVVHTALRGAGELMHKSVFIFFSGQRLDSRQVGQRLLAVVLRLKKKLSIVKSWVRRKWVKASCNEPKGRAVLAAH